MFTQHAAFPPPTGSRRRRWQARAATAVLAAAGLITGLGGVPAAQATTRTRVTAPAPATPADLPAGIEDLAQYVPADSCDPHAKPGVTAFGDLLRATYPDSSYGIDRACGVDPIPTSEHYDGRAIDWFRSVHDAQQRADVHAVIHWLFATDAAGDRYANARRLGIMYIIWNNRIWGAYRADEGWRPYGSCANEPSVAYDTTCHRDHVHFSLSWEGAMGRTSFWTGQVAATDYGPCRSADLNWAAPYRHPRAIPCPDYPRVVAPAGASPVNQALTTYSGMVLRRGSTGPAVTAVQEALGVDPVGVFGPVTQATVKTWKTGHGLVSNGVVTAPMWRQLLAATAPPPAPAPVPDPTSDPAPVIIPPTSSTPAPAATDPTMQRVANPLYRFRHTVLRPGARGPAVRALQRRLRLRATGRYNRATYTAVRRFKVRHRLRHNGLVTKLMWRKLGAYKPA